MCRRTETLVVPSLSVPLGSKRNESRASARRLIEMAARELGVSELTIETVFNDNVGITSDGRRAPGRRETEAVIGWTTGRVTARCGATAYRPRLTGRQRSTRRRSAPKTLNLSSLVLSMLRISTLMVLVGIAACAVPARYALRVQPTEAIRDVV